MVDEKKRQREVSRVERIRTMEKTSENGTLEKLDEHISKAGRNQTMRRGNAPEHKPRTWEEIEAYAEWIGAIRAREALLALREELTA